MQALPLHLHEAPALASLFASVAGRAIVTEVAQILGQANIPVMPLKGALLHATVYADARRRGMVDVDVLLPVRFRKEAEAILARNGWRAALAGSSTTMMVKATRPLPLDVHYALYGKFRFGPHPDQMFARARPDRELFGVEVLVPRSDDLYAHLIGHFAHDRRDQRQMESLIDFQEVARRFQLDPGAVARHLERNGLRRAARYALTLACEHAGDSFAADVLRRLAPDPMGDALSGFVIATVQKRPQPSKLAAIPAVLLAPSLCGAATTLARHVAKAVVRETRGALRRHGLTPGHVA